MQQLESVHERLVQLLRYMESELDNRKLYANTTKTSAYVDWSPDLNGDTPESRMATQFEFMRAFATASTCCASCMIHRMPTLSRSPRTR